VDLLLAVLAVAAVLLKALDNTVAAMVRNTMFWRQLLEQQIQAAVVVAVLLLLLILELVALAVQA
jgi:hypothetical protein